MKFFLIALISINLFSPSFTEMNETYQDSLITHRQNWTDQNDDIQFQFGPTIKGFKKWNRTYLGFPGRPIVFDIQYDSNILQCRIDTNGLFKNLIPSYIPLLILIIRKVKERNQTT